MSNFRLSVAFFMVKSGPNPLNMFACLVGAINLVDVVVFVMQIHQGTAAAGIKRLKDNTLFYSLSLSPLCSSSPLCSQHLCLIQY